MMLRRHRGKTNSETGSIRRFTRSVSRGFLKIAGVLGAIALVSVFFLTLYQFTLTSPQFRLEKVRVEGADPELEKELIAMGGLHTGLSVPGIPLQKLRQQMESHPWVRSVQMERRLPHTLLIRVEKQEPLAIVTLDQNYFMNIYGELFKKVAAVDPVDLPVVTGLKADAPDLRENLAEAVRVLNVLKAEEAPWSIKDLAEIHLKSGSGISLYYSHLRAEIQVSSDEIARKFPALKRLAAYLEHSGRIDRVREINLNYGDAIVASFRKG